jgi:hypothetical protein
MQGTPARIFMIEHDSAKYILRIPQMQAISISRLRLPTRNLFLSLLPEKYINSLALERLDSKNSSLYGTECNVYGKFRKHFRQYSI